MNRVNQENNPKDEKIQYLLEELMSTLDLYYDNSLEIETGSSK